jgi:FkbM family methyltransferase
MLNIKKIPRYFRAVRNIKKTGANENIKSILSMAARDILLMEKFDARLRTAEFYKYKVKFCTLESFYHLFNEIFSKQEYYFEAENNPPHIIDCGSNIGMSVLYFKMLFPSSEILAFEPDPAAFAALEHNVIANNLASVTLNRKAVSDREGEINFYYDDDNPGSLAMSTVYSRMPKKQQIVEAVCLSNYINHDVDFMKLDVEGAEDSVITDLHRNNKLTFIRKMIIEYHHHVDAKQDSMSRILSMLEDSGFGYEIETSAGVPFKGRRFQDVLIYAYRK